MVKHSLGATITYAAGAVVGLVIAVIVTFNLHILVGLEQGYAASPAEVFEHSVLLGLFDVLLLITAPALGVLGVGQLRRQERHQPK